VADLLEAIISGLRTLADRVEQGGGHDRPRRLPDRPEEQPPLQVVPSHAATPFDLALKPHLTIQLSEEQTEIALAIERDAANASREAATTS
jgi:hypothetical protein